jgi:hypothetical protein
MLKFAQSTPFGAIRTESPVETGGNFQLLVASSR